MTEPLELLTGSIQHHRVVRVEAEEPRKLGDLDSYIATIKIFSEVPSTYQKKDAQRLLTVQNVVLFFKTMPETWQSGTIYDEV